MSGEVIIAIISAVGASGVVGAIVTWLRDHRRTSVEVTQILNDLSKDALLSAKGELDGIRRDLKEVKDILAELVTCVEQEVLPLLSAEHQEVERHLRVISSRARERGVR